MIFYYAEEPKLNDKTTTQGRTWQHALQISTKLLLRPDQVDSQFIVRDIWKSHAGRRSFFIFHIMK